MAFSIRRMQQRFERQFEATDHGAYLYRCYFKGAAIPVTPGERDAFTEQYMVRLYVILSVMVLALMILLGVLVMRTGARSMGQVPPAQIFAGMVAISIVATGWMEWVFRAPARALKGRTPVAGLSKDAARAASFKRFSYAQLALLAGIGATAPFAHRHNSWHRAYWPIGACLVAAAAITAFRKWRFENAQSDDPQA
jgi:hypothetical protein